jgi:hypothetical protein
MFCVKTSVGYFNYLRFVCLFPQPSTRKLLIMLLISFFIAIACVAFAVGFNFYSSFKITQLYAYKLCWFTHDVLYYFLTIPVCLFILINIITFILVAIHIIKHVRNASSEYFYKRMMQCVLVLLSSSITQGIGWLVGPFISLISPTAGNVLGWFFIIFNGLEGLWAIILYIIIRLQRIDESKRIQAKRELAEEKRQAALDIGKMLSTEENKKKRRDARRNDEIKHQNQPKEESHSLNNLSDLRTINSPVDDDDIISTRF